MMIDTVPKKASRAMRPANDRRRVPVRREFLDVNGNRMPNRPIEEIEEMWNVAQEGNGNGNRNRRADEERKQNAPERQLSNATSNSHDSKNPNSNGKKSK